MSSHEGLARDSFVRKWKDSAHCSNNRASMSAEEFATMAEDSLTNNISSHHTRRSTATESSGGAHPQSGDEVQALVKNLTAKVQNAEDDTLFSITAREIRLLLGLGLGNNKQQQFSAMSRDYGRRRLSSLDSSLPRLCELDASETSYVTAAAAAPGDFTSFAEFASTDEMPMSTSQDPTERASSVSPPPVVSEPKSSLDSVPPPMVTEPKDPSDLFHMWDFSSQEDLSAEEVQAVMIALAAENQQRMEGQKEDSVNMPRPSPLSSRDVSIQPLDKSNSSLGSTEFLVTLGGAASDGSGPTRPSRTLQRQPVARKLTIHHDHDDEEEEKKAEEAEQATTNTIHRPNQIAGREVSVRHVQTHEEGSHQESNQFVVTFTDICNASGLSIAGVPGASNDGNDDDDDSGIMPMPRPLMPRPPSAFSAMARQISIQPVPFDGPYPFEARGNPFTREESDSGTLMMPVPSPVSRPGIISERQVSVRLNGNPKPVSFRVHGF